MQFHQDGYRPGDPAAAATGPAPSGDRPLPREVDVLIVGSGPTGLTLAAQLSAFPDISVAVAESKPGPLTLGQADGIACRTMEMFHAFGFAHKVLHEAYQVNETVFWEPDPARPGTVRRSHRIQDVEDGLSEMPHVILNQARVHDFFLEVMANARAPIHPHYRRRFVDLDPPEGGGDGQVVARFEVVDEHGNTEQGPRVHETVRARYVVGCDGARSRVRRSLGRSLVGDAANQVWGVMDVLGITDFPDVRFKVIMHAEAGNLIIIPREGGYMTRFYIEMGRLDTWERAADRALSLDNIVGAANRILRPYRLDPVEVPWWSVYEIGQRLCARFDDGEPGTPNRAPRVFIAGDACHTHSPKAGQGMNVSMQDGFNLGWKLAAVIQGRADPCLLSTYSDERHAVADELIRFDRELATMMNARPRPTGRAGGSDPDPNDHEPDGHGGHGHQPDGDGGHDHQPDGNGPNDHKPDGNGGHDRGNDQEVGVDPVEFRRYFEQHGRFTAGVATRYRPSLITSNESDRSPAGGFPVGMRFHSAPVVRLADGKPVELGQAALADGRWRLYAFADPPRPDDPGSRLGSLCRWLSGDPRSPILRYTPEEADTDSIFDLRAVFQQSHHDLSVSSLPSLLLPRSGRLALTDYEKGFSSVVGNGPDIFELRGIDRSRGAVVVVRPDQHVAHVAPLDDHATLVSFFEGFLTPSTG